MPTTSTVMSSDSIARIVLPALEGPCGGVAYGFTPTISDPDLGREGDTHLCSVTGLPSWAAFDPADGALTGTPGNDDAGADFTDYIGITITVTDQNGAGLSVSIGPFTIRVVDVTPPGAVIGLAAAPGDGQVELSWSNPTEADLAGFAVLYRDDGVFPSGPNDSGATVVDTSLVDATPGAAVGLVADGLTNSSTYHFAVYAQDEVPNPSSAATLAATLAATPEAPWVATEGGTSHSMGLRSNGTLWAWGGSGSGQLGLGDTTGRNSPVEVPTPAGAAAGTTWSALAAGSSHSLALRSDGTLWAWGGNGSAQLGLGDITGRSSPVEVPTPAGAAAGTTWSALAAGSSHSLALRSDGTLWAWGESGSGQLGTPSVDDCGLPCSLTPLEVPTPAGAAAGTTWSAVSAGSDHNLALRSDGTLWAWGKNTYGQLGQGNTTSLSSPVEVPTPVGAAAGTTWSALAGYNHSLALRSDGTLWAWGRNKSGQLGQGDTTSLSSPVEVPTPVGAAAGTTWSALTAAGGYSLALRSDETLWAWGSNQLGQLGTISADTCGPSVGSYPCDKSPVEVPTPAGAAAGTTWSAVSSGLDHSLAVRSDGTLWAWGDNFPYGELGLGHSSGGVTSPTQVP